MRLVNGRKVLTFFISLAVLIGGACGLQNATPRDTGEVLMPLEISSESFDNNASIPIRYTCDGDDLSPPLSWSSPPENTKSLVLIVDDPDAPRGTWVHWVLYEIPTTLTSLSEGVVKSPVVEGVGIQGTNDFREVGYDGPCPPRGSTHRYFFKLHALDIHLDLESGATKAQVEAAMQGHVLAMGQLVGIYKR